MHEFVSFNNRIIPIKAAILPSVSGATFYGRGNFTTLAIYNRKPFLWSRHWHRLVADAKKIGVDLSDFSEPSVLHSLFDIIEKNNLINARARLTFFDQSASLVWKMERERRTNFLITTADLRLDAENLNLTISPFTINSVSPLAGVKSCNYLENMLAFEQARTDGFDEAVRLNANSEVVSACLANIFWVKAGEIFTPSLKTGCLAGTTRSFVLENYSVKECESKLSSIIEADEIFLTSSGIGIAKITSFNERKITGKIVNQLQKEFSVYCSAATRI